MPRDRKPLGVLNHRLRPRPRLEDQYEAYEALWAGWEAELQVALAQGDRANAARLSAHLASICRTREHWRRRVAAEARRPDLARPALSLVTR